jgi:hypothetical protein
VFRIGVQRVSKDMNIQDWKTNAHTGIGPLVPETKIKYPFFILSVRKFNLCMRVGTRFI